MDLSKPEKEIFNFLLDCIFEKHDKVEDLVTSFDRNHIALLCDEYAELKTMIQYFSDLVFIHLGEEVNVILTKTFRYDNYSEQVVKLTKLKEKINS